MRKKKNRFFDISNIRKNFTKERESSFFQIEDNEIPVIEIENSPNIQTNNQIVQEPQLEFDEWTITQITITEEALTFESKENCNLANEEQEINKISKESIEPIGSIKKTTNYVWEIEKRDKKIKRLETQVENLKKFGSSDLIKDILKSFDLMLKVIKTSNLVENKEIKNYLMGFNMIIDQMKQTLELNGVEKIETNIGDEFDYNIHDANEQIDSNNIESNHIVEVISNGYKLNGRVIVHTIVKVAK